MQVYISCSGGESIPSRLSALRLLDFTPPDSRQLARSKTKGHFRELPIPRI